MGFCKAKKKLLILGSYSMLEQNSIFHLFLNLIKQNHWISFFKKKIFHNILFFFIFKYLYDLPSQAHLLYPSPKEIFVIE